MIIILIGIIQMRANVRDYINRDLSAKSIKSEANTKPATIDVMDVSRVDGSLGDWVIEAEGPLIPNFGV